MSSFKVECDICSTSITFGQKPKISSLKGFGFYYWGDNVDGSYYCTCDACTEEVNNFARGNMQKEDEVKSQRGKRLKVYNLNTRAQEEFDIAESFEAAFAEEYGDIFAEAHRHQPQKEVILYREI